MKNIRKTRHMGHVCDLNLGSDSMLPVQTTPLGKLCRQIKKLCQLSEHHPRTFDYYRSYSAVVAERQRYLLEKAGNVIHPLSLLSIIWSTFMIFVNMLHMFMSTFRVFYVLYPIEEIYTIHKADSILLFLHLVCLVDIAMKFNTGYITDLTPVLDRRWIAYRYLRRWFFWDLVSSVPAGYFMLALRGSRRSLFIAHILPLIRAARLHGVTKDIKHSLRIVTDSYIVHGVARLYAVFVLTVHWCGCLTYVPPVSIYYWTGEMPYKYNNYLKLDDDDSLLAYDMRTRYYKAVIVAISSFVGTGYSMYYTRQPEELLIHTFILFYATIFTIFSLVFGIKSYLSIFGSSIRYHGLVNQVERYMRYRQFPTGLKKRVQDFYHYTYQERYFKEDGDLDCLSEELRDEIRLHTCRTLVHKVKLFEDTPPSVVGTVLGCLKSEVYLCNELVQGAGDIGECMFFIGTGTVAVYSLKGIEVCHLEDGAHFGEVALLMKDCKRVATVVAVEITLLYRLEAKDFRRYVATHSLLYERVQALATRRMNQIVVLDEEFRRDKESHEGDTEK